MNFNQTITRWAVLALVFMTASSSVMAQDTLLTVPEANVEEEMANFEVVDGFEVNLFASDPMVANPISMNWDDEGRLWVVGSRVYPHIAPGEKATDNITVLEDTDGDGRADKSTLFADNLFIPTGILPGDGGVYVANSPELLFLKDTDGDGKADETRVVLSGFGTEDTHQTLHSLRWGYDGLLYMNQSIYIHSHIETPHGVRRLNAAGIWQFRPETMELDVVSRGQVNPWGHHYDIWGQSFSTDGAYHEGINYIFPGAAFVTVYQIPRILHGLNAFGTPKHCGLEILSGSHLPEEWRGTMITNDFRGQRVNRFMVTDEPAGYVSVEQPEVLKSTHVSFRPVDVKMGPDGAIYIADWYNPIIQHGEVAFRDPRRDHEHGRIWRITAKDRPLVKRPDFRNASIPELLGMLTLEEQWNRIHAKRELKIRDRKKVLNALDQAVAALKVTGEQTENQRLELLWTYQTIDEVRPEFLKAVLASNDYRVRAAAVRVLSQWKGRLNDEADYVKQLTALVADEHFRVQLEAVRALSRVNSAEAADIAMRVLTIPVAEMETNLEYALWTTMRDIKASWLPELDSGALAFTKDNDRMLYALKAIDSGEAVRPLLALYQGDTLTPEQDREALDVMVNHADAKAMGEIVAHILKAEALSDQQRADHLNHVVNTSQRRNVKPDTDLILLSTLIESEAPGVRNAAVRAAGQWGVQDLRTTLVGIVQSKEQPEWVRTSTIEALAKLGGEASQTLLEQIAASSDDSMNVRSAATQNLLKMSVDSAAKEAVLLLQDIKDGDPAALYRSFLKTDGAPAALTKALEGVTLSAEIAKIGEREISSSGRKEEALLAALSTAGGLGEGRAPLTDVEMAALVKKVQTNGDAARGRKHFRELGCFQCHAIAGAGGKLGPDMTSIGGSAQIDYLIDSNYFPDKAIKEGFHSLLVENKDYELFSGIRVSETDTELILRSATNPEIRIPLNTIETREDGGSLMPSGLVDGLLENEFVDLVRFLSSLGREPEFSAGTGRHARVWRALSDTQAATDYLYETKPEAALEPHETLAWEATYSFEPGHLPLSEVPTIKHRYWQTPYSFLQFSLEASSAGKAALSLSPVDGMRLWVNGKEVPVSARVLVDVANGQTDCTLIIDRSKANDSVDVQLVDDPKGTVTAQFVGGL